MPKRTFEKCFGILNSGGSLSRKEGTSRPRKFSGSDRRRVAGIALKNTNFSSQQIAHRFREKTSRLMCKSSAYRNLLRSRIGKMFPRRIPLLTLAHLKKILSLDIGNRTDSRMFSDRRVIVSTVLKHCQSLELSPWKGTRETDTKI